MYITGFEYDGNLLSEFGYVVCSFDKSSAGEVSNGSNIEFTTVPMNYGTHHLLAHSTYPECITATFQICKNPCLPNYNPAMSLEDIMILSKWLNRRDFHKLKIIAPNTPDYEHFYFEGTFKSISRYEFGGDTIGLTLEFISNSPFAIGEEVRETLTFADAGTQNVDFFTGVIGRIYPDVEVTCGADGDLVINGTRIRSCVNGEVISLHYPLLRSSERTDAELAQDFNYNFIHFDSIDINDEGIPITVSMPCVVEISYHPEYKIGL